MTVLLKKDTIHLGCRQLRINMKIFKVEQWNLELLLPLFEEYRLSQGMTRDLERTLAFLQNRIRFGESIIFMVVSDDANQALGFVQLYPHISALKLHRYWQLCDMYISPLSFHEKVTNLLISKAKDFVSYTNSPLLTMHSSEHYQESLQKFGFKRDPHKSIFELEL